MFQISTHAPLAGRDGACTLIGGGFEYFNPRAPCGARLRRIDLCFDVIIFQPTRPLRGATFFEFILNLPFSISTHAPLAGRDAISVLVAGDRLISTHAPLAGRDYHSMAARRQGYDFNPRAPCGARLQQRTSLRIPCPFQPTRPLRGATSPCLSSFPSMIFQPTRPLRGATSLNRNYSAYTIISTHAPLAGRDVPCSHAAAKPRYFNPRAPCGARRGARTSRTRATNFNPRAPCGARPSCVRCSPRGCYFNPRAPCGARQVGDKLYRVFAGISTHAPLAGRDNHLSFP